MARTIEEALIEMGHAFGWPADLRWILAHLYSPDSLTAPDGSYVAEARRLVEAQLRVPLFETQPT